VLYHPLDQVMLVGRKFAATADLLSMHGRLRRHYPTGPAARADEWVVENGHSPRAMTLSAHDRVGRRSRNESDELRMTSRPVDQCQVHIHLAIDRSNPCVFAFRRPSDQGAIRANPKRLSPA
jgi:hypothetical protein